MTTNQCHQGFLFCMWLVIWKSELQYKPYKFHVLITFETSKKASSQAQKEGEAAIEQILFFNGQHKKNYIFTAINRIQNTVIEILEWH
jgi:hypothetical protein